MKEISPYDASVLALLAEHPALPETEEKRLLDGVGLETRKIAKALKKLRSARKRSSVPRNGPGPIQTAAGLLEWVEGNRSRPAPRR